MHEFEEAQSPVWDSKMCSAMYLDTIVAECRIMDSYHYTCDLYKKL